MKKPARRAPCALPRTRPISTVPGARAVARAPGPAATRAPRARAIGQPPNPRRPRLVKDVHGNELKDMFVIFKDLPRPARPAPRLPPRVRRGEKRHR
jgi:hypothetical protein